LPIEALRFRGESIFFSFFLISSEKESIFSLHATIDRFFLFLRPRWRSVLSLYRFDALHGDLLGRACLTKSRRRFCNVIGRLSVRTDRRKEREAWVDNKTAACGGTGDAHIRTTTIGTPRVACLLATVCTRTHVSSSLTELFLPVRPHLILLTLLYVATRK
jgi:hypothetical protein